MLLVVFRFLLFEADNCDCLTNPVFGNMDVCPTTNGFCFFLKGFPPLERELSHIYNIYSVSM